MIGGYCFFNNAAIAAAEMARRLNGPVAIVDVDYHHGNGTQSIFYDRDDVFYASLHGSPDGRFPITSVIATRRARARGWVGITTSNWRRAARTANTSMNSRRVLDLVAQRKSWAS